MKDFKINGKNIKAKNNLEAAIIFKKTYNERINEITELPITAKTFKNGKRNNYYINPEYCPIYTEYDNIDI